MKTNFNLLRAIKEKGLTQREFAGLVDDHETVVSRIINNVYNADDVRKIRYAKVLGKRPEDLFAD